MILLRVNTQPSCRALDELNLNQQARLIVSNQHGPHPDLAKLHAKHERHSFHKPISQTQHQVFQTTYATWRTSGCPPTLLDIGCGTGESSRKLAVRNPDLLVVGIDQSSSRLQRGMQGELPDNLLLVRARAEEFWLQMMQTEWRAAAMSFFYPNPWPKKKHVMRRWHAHPIWPRLCNWCPAIMLRTNWKLYAEEWALTLTWQGIGTEVTQLQPGPALTAFERKYQASGHKLVQVETLAWRGKQITVDNKEAWPLY